MDVDDLIAIMATLIYAATIKDAPTLHYGDLTDTRRIAIAHALALHDEMRAQLCGRVHGQ